MSNNTAEVIGIDHVQLAGPTGCEARAKEFYGQLLGMLEVRKPEALLRNGGCWFRSGDLNLHIGVSADFIPATKAHPGLLVRDIESVAKRLSVAQYPVEWDYKLPGYRRFYSSDPFGNRLEFLEPADR